MNEVRAGLDGAERLVDVFRGGLLECVHYGHAAISRVDGTLVESWGNPDSTFLPRSASKMLQALPLLESGAGADLEDTRLALACASHSAERVHVERVGAWLDELELDEKALACGPQASRDADLAEAMIREGEPVTRLCNWCSGKHAGFLTVAKHLGAGPDYVDPGHAVQVAVREAFEDMTGMVSPGFGIDGCSAPNFATTVRGMATAMARFAVAGKAGGVRDRSAARLRNAMIAHPDMVAGTGRADTVLMRACREPVAIKSGAEGVHVAILPSQSIGIAIKVSDGASRASEGALAALLVRLGVADATHPDVARYLNMPVLNWDGLVTGSVRPVRDLLF